VIRSFSGVLPQGHSAPILFDGTYFALLDDNFFHFVPSDDGAEQLSVSQAYADVGTAVELIGDSTFLFAESAVASQASDATESAHVEAIKPVPGSVAESSVYATLSAIFPSGGTSELKLPTSDVGFSWGSVLEQSSQSLSASTAPNIIIDNALPITSAAPAASLAETGSAAAYFDSGSFDDTGPTAIVVQNPANTYPYDCVCYITVNIPGAGAFRGSGAIIGPHTILTASHVLWSADYNSGATSITVTPGYSNGGTAITGQWSSHYFTLDDHGGLISAQQSQYDYAIIDFAANLSSYGSFGIMTDYAGGTVHATGYPSSAGFVQTDVTGTVFPDGNYSILDYGTLYNQTSPGNSGGPLWIDLGTAGHPSPYIVGVVSTSGWGTQITSSDWQTIQGWQSQDSYLWANHPPVVAVADHTVHAQSFTSLASWVSYSDADSNAAVTYQFVDNNGAAGSARFWSPSGYLAAGDTLTIAASGLSNVWVGGASVTGSETMYVRVFDGTDWSAWDPFTLTLTNTAPVAAIADHSLHTTTWAQAAGWLSYSDANGDAATMYEFVDVGGAPGSGQLWTASTGYISTGATLSVTAANLGTVWIGGATTTGSETMYMRAFDGVDWSAWDPFTLTSTNTAPVATINDHSLHTTTWAQVSSWLSYSDANGDAAIRYEFVDSGSAAGSGQFWTPGTGYLSPGATLSVAAGDLGNVWVGGATTTGAETMWVRAFDGASWSNWDSFTLTSTNTAPVATINDHSLVVGQWAQVQNWLSYSDANGDAPAYYQFVDATGTAGSGQFWTPAGGNLAAGPTWTVAAADIGNVWVGGANNTGTDTMWVRASDGASWSNWDSFTFTATANHAPTAAIADHSVVLNQWTQVQNWLSYSDADGNAATMYQFVDQSTGAGSGRFWTPAGYLAAGPTPLTVTAADLPNVWVGGATTASSDAMWVRAYDGHDWSSWDPFTLTSHA
jgi:V8-like Glu-specific endopeptidase